MVLFILYVGSTELVEDDAWQICMDDVWLVMIDSYSHRFAFNYHELCVYSATTGCFDSYLLCVHMAQGVSYPEFINMFSH